MTLRCFCSSPEHQIRCFCPPRFFSSPKTRMLRIAMITTSFLGHLNLFHSSIATTPLNWTAVKWIYNFKQSGFSVFLLFQMFSSSESTCTQIPLCWRNTSEIAKINQQTTSPKDRWPFFLWPPVSSLQRTPQNGSVSQRKLNPGRNKKLKRHAPRHWDTEKRNDPGSDHEGTKFISCLSFRRRSQFACCCFPAFHSLCHLRGVCFWLSVAGVVQLTDPIPSADPRSLVTPLQKTHYEVTVLLPSKFLCCSLVKCTWFQNPERFKGARQG